MELWIRSQDREIMLSNPILIVDDNRILTPKNDYRDTHLVLGHYKTKERALEVLDEIEERIMLLNTTNFVYDTATLVGFKNALGEDKIKGLGYPYQMPED